MEWLSESVEALIEDLAGGRLPAHAASPAAIVVGSGYGGAVAALRIAEAGKNVILLERGREFLPGEFPNELSLLAGQVRIQRADSDKAIGKPDALFDVRANPEVAVVVGNALGGGSQINANVALQPEERVFRQPEWPRKIRKNPAALDRHYAEAAKMLGVDRARPFSNVDKVALMQELADVLEPINGGRRRAAPADLAVHFGAAGENRHGARQNPCCGCGDCVSGCNYAAKNTLTMNYLPAAWRAGARLCTGATVLSLRRGVDDRTGRETWIVLFRRTADENEPGARVYEIEAEVVVLAAGTLGSTEILLRSRRRWDLSLSPMLGQRFSCNGDLIGVGFDQRQPGHAVGGVHEDGANHHQSGHAVGGVHDDGTNLHQSGHAVGDLHGGGANVPCPGPTISAIIDLRGTDDLGHGVVLQNGVIPGALGRMFEEVVTCAAVPPQMLEKNFRHDDGARQRDPHAVIPEAIAHSHVYLAIAHDDAAGELKLRDTPLAELDRARLRVHWPGAGEQDIYAREEELLKRTEARALHGIYLNNPLWKPLPDEFARLLSGPQPRGPVLTVHPLGGCPMGDDAASGATNHKGEVFLGASGTDVHRGLYVMDGSVIPRSLGVNPLLTIAALAERNAGLLVRDRNWTGTALDRALAPMPKIDPRAPHETPVAIRFSERMRGRLEGGAPFLPQAAPHLTSLTLDFVVEDVDAFLQKDPAHEVKEVCGVIAFGEEQDGKVTMLRAFRVAGSIELLSREPSGRWTRVRRALCQWLRARGWREIVQRLRRDTSGLWQEIKRFLILASHIGERRFMSYALSFDAHGTRYRLTGRKTIQYARDSNPWRSLADLEASIAPQNGGAPALSGTLTLDFVDSVKNRVPQIVAQRDAPSGAAALLRIGLWMARILFKTHFWSFEAPEYPPAGRPRRRYPGRLPDGIRELELTRHWATPDPTRPLERILLTRYRSATARADATPVMLLHGFAHSGLVFAIDTVKPNMVQHLCQRGFDVWVVELRTSIALPSSLRQWTFDQIALEDVPVAVQKIIEIARPAGGKIKVVAHCMGAACFSMAALAGRLAREDGTSMIEAAVLMQVAPIIEGSPSNRLRANLAGFMRDSLGLELVDTSVDDSRTWLDVIADRIAMTYPLPESEAAAHRSLLPFCARTDLANCNRNSALFGRQWKHANLSRETHEAVGELLGHANTTTFAQIAHFIERGRVVDREGANVYALNENICKHMNFPIAFVHGMENDVFHPNTSIKTHRTFAALNSKTCYELHLIPEYGHLDCLLGKNAHADVFAKVSEFLQSDCPPRAGLQGAVVEARPPRLGPILGWIRRDIKTGQPLVRIWVKANAEDASPALMLLTLVFEGIGPDLAARKPPPDQLRIWPILQLCQESVALVDVPLPDASRDYSILPVTVHLSERCVPARQLEAVRAAARRAATRGMSLHEALESADATPAPDGAAHVSPAALTDWLRGLYEALPEEIVRDHRRAEVPLPRRLLQHTLEKRSKLSFLAGSCRFPGTAFEGERSDAIFRDMLDLLDGDEDSAPALLLMLGDQIYADATAELFDIASPRERIVKRYDEAYGSPHLRALMRRLPTFMTADDHEIADNWEPGHRKRRGGEDTYKWGRSAYRCHQWAASPRAAEAGPLVDDSNLHSDRFWYEFESGGFGFFVMDTRFEREERDGPSAAGYAIASRRQIEALKNWLSARRDDLRPKFIACGSVVVPFVQEVVERRAYALRDDSWYGYQDSLQEVLDYIAQKKIPNVVFLCGDYHVSFASVMQYGVTLADGSPLRSYCIVASPLYGPLPFANGRIDEHVLDTAKRAAARIRLPGGAWLDYKVIDAFEGDSFARVDACENAGAWQLQVRFHRGPQVLIRL